MSTLNKTRGKYLTRVEYSSRDLANNTGINAVLSLDCSSNSDYKIE